jgi:hypothetical protein
VGPPGARHAWLSITPEPERELPRAVATLRAGGPPSEAAVEAERARAETLVTRGRRTAWSNYLAEARRLAEAAPADDARAQARALVLEVLDNHDGLLLGLTKRRR